MINGRWKHPNIVRSRIEKDIKPHLGKLALDAVEPRHIDAMLRALVKHGAPTIANDIAPRCDACSTTPSSATSCVSTRQRLSTWRTQAARNWRVSGRCRANHKLKGVEGVYNRHDYFAERRRGALEAWGQLLLNLERQGPHPKKPAAAHQQAPLAQEA